MSSIRLLVDLSVVFIGEKFQFFVHSIIIQHLLETFLFRYVLFTNYATMLPTMNERKFDKTYFFREIQFSLVRSSLLYNNTTYNCHK